MPTSRREALKTALVGALVAAVPGMARGATAGRRMSRQPEERVVPLKDGSRLEITRDGNFLVRGGQRIPVDKGQFELPGGDVMGVEFVESFNQFIEFPDDFIQGGGREQRVPGRIREEYDLQKMKRPGITR